MVRLSPFSLSLSLSLSSFLASVFSYLGHLPRAVGVVRAPGGRLFEQERKETGEPSSGPSDWREKKTLPLKKKKKVLFSFFPHHQKHTTHLAAKTLPEALTKQIPTLRRYSCTCRTATTVEEGGAGCRGEEEEEEEEASGVDGDDDATLLVADVAFEEGTAAAADWGDGEELVLLRGVGDAPAEAAAKTAERMEAELEREKRAWKREERKKPHNQDGFSPLKKKTKK